MLKPRFSLTTKLIIAFLMIALIPVGVVAFLNQQNLQEILTANADTNLATAAFQTASTIDAFILMNLSLTDTLAKLPMIVRFIDTSAANRPGSTELRDIMRTLRGQNKYITAYVLLDVKGNMVAGDDYYGLSGQNQTHQDYFAVPMQTGQSFVSEVIFNEKTQEWSWFFSSPVRNLLGDSIGVLYIRYDAAVLQELVTPSLNLAGEEGFPFLFDSQQRYLAGGVPHIKPFQLLTDVKFNDNFDLALPTSRFFSSTDLRADHAPYRLAVVTLKTRPWSVAFAQPEQVFLAPVEAQNRRTLLFSLGLGGIVTLVAFLVGQNLARPLFHLTQQVTQFTQGNLESRAHVTSRDERGILAQSFNLMAEQVGSLLKRLEQHTLTLELEIQERQRTEAELQRYRDHLELLVVERTAELVQARDLAEKASQAKSTFLANVSHELRTPLTSILGFTRMIQKRLDEKIFPLITSHDPKVKRAEEQVRQNVVIILKEGERLTQLINEVLDLAKIEAAKVGWQHQTFQVETMVQQAVDATTALFVDKPLTLMLDISPHLPPIQGDFNRLIQVMINLISNAVKFTPQGTITCQAILHDNQELLIKVIDTGVGIAAADQAKIFEKFEQVGDTLTDKPQGTGLGLSICKEIVAHHGGRIWVESQLGQGSCFAFTLPVGSENESLKG